MDAQAEFDRLSGTFYVSGQYRTSASDERKAVTNPATGTKIGELAHVTLAEVDEVVAAANAAQKAWWAISGLERSELMHEAARTIKAITPQVAEIMTRETGKPFKEGFDELSWSYTATDYYAELGRHSVGSNLGNTVPGQMHYTSKEPMGVVVIILPANFPIVLLMWEAAAALAAGNVLVHHDVEVHGSIRVPARRPVPMCHWWRSRGQSSCESPRHAHGWVHGKCAHG